MMLRIIAVGMIASTLAGCGFLGLGGGDDLVGCREGFQSIADVTDAQVADLGMGDAALLVQVDGETVCRLLYGEYTPTSPMYIASAAKWLSAGAVLAVIDRGDLQLDTKVSAFYPSTPHPLADVTLAQLISHTSGMPGWHPCLDVTEGTLDMCVQDMLDLDLLFPPGTGFLYGGPAFSLAGAMAQRATGKLWYEIFAEVMATPLGLTSTTYREENPTLSEGFVTSSLEDYGRFAAMMLDDGVWEGKRVLSHEMVLAMRTNWAEGTTPFYSPTETASYGLGAWVGSLDEDGYARTLTSPGAQGFYPLVDYDRRMVVVFAVEDNIQRIGDGLTEILRAIREAVDASDQAP
jgi:CubicO group peptidase (beta-lactamase class C family)